jgi:hypothetical protein
MNDWPAHDHVHAADRGAGYYLVRLSLLPLDRDQRRPMARRSSAIGYRAEFRSHPCIRGADIQTDEYPLCRQGKKKKTGYRELVGRYQNRLVNRL